MQNISLDHYQDFLLRYIDGALDLRETEALLAFIVLHPAIEKELELLQLTKLEVPQITYPNKALLYKNIFPVTLEPETIVYPHKQKLFKKEKEKAPVVLLKWWAVGAAAVFLFMMVRYGMLDQKAGTALSKKSISKKSVSKAAPNTIKNNAAINNTIINNDAVRASSWTATTVVANQKNSTTNTPEYTAAQGLESQALQNAYTITTHETTQNIPSYNGDIINVKPTVIAEIRTATIELNEANEPKETIENIETIDTEAASSNRSIMVGAFEIDKDKFRGLFRRANALFKNKENNKNEK